VEEEEEGDGAVLEGCALALRRRAGCSLGCIKEGGPTEGEASIAGPAPEGENVRVPVSDSVGAVTRGASTVFSFRNPALFTGACPLGGEAGSRCHGADLGP
jgi:hypothetical protein